MDVWEIIHGIAAVAVQRSWAFLGTTKWGFFLVPIAAYLVQLRLDKSPRNWRKYVSTFLETLGATLIVICFVFPIQFLFSMHEFLHPERMAFPAPSPETPQPFPAQGVYEPFIASPKTALLKVDIVPTATFLPDGRIVVVPIIHNVSGRTLKTSDYGGFSFVTSSPQNPLERAQLEDSLWETNINGKKTKIVVELSTIGDGTFNQKFPMGPFTGDQINQILDGTASLYFLKLVTDTTTGKHLAEFCVYVKPDKALGLCHKHNMP
jgi:hypothetical protein